MTALDTACHAIGERSRETERLYVRALATTYIRARHLPVAMGWDVAAPRGDDPELTRRLIKALGTCLSYQVKSRQTPLRLRRTRVALFGECLILKRQREEREPCVLLNSQIDP